MWCLCVLCAHLVEYDILQLVIIVLFNEFTEVCVIRYWISLESSSFHNVEKKISNFAVKYGIIVGWLVGLYWLPFMFCIFLFLLEIVCFLNFEIIEIHVNWFGLYIIVVDVSNLQVGMDHINLYTLLTSHKAHKTRSNTHLHILDGWD